MAKDKIFEENEKLDVYYKTSDNTPFFTKNAATAHAKTLKNSNVEKVTRKSQKSEDPTDEDNAGTQNTGKLVRKEVVKAYFDKFNEEPSKNFTVEEINEAVEKGEKLENPA